ncbi:MAG: SMC-Scp complex subunit ScpB [Bdellovibrionaceae bacterium]|nr:SMC-Scp complex subunit ScpB [Pseudobdellovibrionaceae bacterium]
MVVGEVEQLPMLGLEATVEAQTEEEEEIIEEPTEFIEADQLVSILESLLFATDKPVSVGVMKQIFKGSNVRTKDITRALDQLASSYASADRGVTLEEIHGGYQLRTKVDNTEYLRRLQKNRPFRLSGPALEVLAIAAYKQPITKHEVDQIRGVESGHLMRALMERGLVGFGEKSDLPGKPMTYVTTRKFLETFGLRNLNELPTLAEIDELLPEGIGEVEEKETLADLTGAMSTELKSSYTEGEEELNTIAESLKVIDTTSEFFEQEKVRQRIERDRERAQDIRERITVGEDVDDKDRRWLSRYEAKEEAAAQAAAAGAQAAPVVVEEEGEGLAAQLSALQQETHEQQAEALDADSDDLKAENWSADDDDETLGDLEANQDYDDESNKE